MGTISPAVLQGGVVLGTSAAAIVTGAASQLAIVKRAVFTNFSGSAASLTVYRVPSGGTPGNATEIIAAQSLAPGQAYVAPELANAVLNPGDTIQAFASAGTSISAQIWGYTQ